MQMSIKEIAELAEVAGTLFTLVAGLKVYTSTMIKVGELMEQLKALGTGHEVMGRKLEALGVQVLKLRLKGKDCGSDDE
jgi:hypothetical protein